MRERARATRSEAIGLIVALAAASASCGEGNPGYDPPDDSMAFPSGLLLDPRVSTEPGQACSLDEPCAEGQRCMSAGYCLETARWLFVTNANSDLRYNAGSLLALDLDAFWQAAFADPAAIQSPETALSADAPPYCRRVANLPQVVECVEEPFVDADATIHFGNFPGPAAAWVRDEGGTTRTTLLVPVRGDPSITYVELTGSDRPRLGCGQDSDADGQRYCDDDHRLRFLGNEPEARRLAREPFRVLVSPDPALPYAYVSHQGAPDLTVLSLTGVSFDSVDDRPAIVHQAQLLGLGGNTAASIQGGFGLAQRPCVPDSNAPNATHECTRPLIYAGMRWVPQVRTVTAIDHDLPQCSGLHPADDPDAEPDPALYDELGLEEKLGYCEAQAEPLRNVQVGNISTADVPVNPARPILGDIGFSREGDELFVVQSNPGALLRIDTSIGPDGETIDVPAGQVEICAQATSFVLYDAGASQYGVVTCYRSGEVFIIDRANLEVVAVSRAGIGPDALAVDLAREVVYVANSLDATISVIDMSPASPTRFTQIARIGIQEPYTR